MSEKRFYWLKLPKDFFKRHDISFIKSLPNGPEIALFYLELMAESVDHDGELRFSEDIPYTDKMLSSVTDTPLDVVESSMQTLQELGLVKIDEEGTIIVPKVIKMIGSASDTDEARRQRRCRERKRAERDKMSHESVTSVTDSVTKDNESKSKSKSKSKSIEIDIKRNTKEKSDSRFIPPTVEEVRAYCLERGNDVDPEKFCAFYQSKNWMVGKNKMKDWRASVRTWERGRETAQPFQKPADTGNQFFKLLQSGGAT